MAAFATTLPIFDRRAKVFAYELSFRFGFGPPFHEALRSRESRVDLWRSMGFDEVLGMAKAVIPFPRDLVVEKAPILFPADGLVVSLPGDVAADPELTEACKRLKEFGYRIAMPASRVEHLAGAFLEFGDIARVDVAETTVEQQYALCEALADSEVCVLAEGVDSAEALDTASEAGCRYFMGEFFRRPVFQPNREVAAGKVQHLRLLREVNKTQLAYDELEGLIKQDVSVAYRLLRFINSAWYGLKTTVESIRHALVLLGPAELRKWASMLVLRELGEDKPPELFRRCLIRARMAEALAPMLALEARASELFLMGMFSLVDVLTGIPMAKALEALPLGDDVKLALLDGGGAYGVIHDAVCCFDMGLWDRFSRDVARLPLEEQVVPDVFRESSRWADEAVGALA
jgi:c-di-GMP-related signal transduction protein